jgi:3-oxoadipate enol-lactonase
MPRIGPLHYIDQGAGDPPLVLLHAFPLSSAMWRPQIDVLATRRRVLAPDLRGFGCSEVPADRREYSVEGWADDVAALLASLGLERVILGGISMGGYVCFAFLRRQAAAVVGLVLADTRAGADTAVVRGRREEQQQRLGAAGDGAQLSSSVHGDELLQPLVGPTSTRREETLGMARRLLAGNRIEGIIGGLEALKNRPDSTGDLAGIGVPTLVVVGDQDQPSPPGVAEDMARAIPGATFALIPDAGHLSNLENPAAFGAALGKWLDRQ